MLDMDCFCLLWVVPWSLKFDKNCLFVGCLASQQHASVSQGQIRQGTSEAPVCVSRSWEQSWFSVPFGTCPFSS